MTAIDRTEGNYDNTTLQARTTVGQANIETKDTANPGIRRGNQATVRVAEVSGSDTKPAQDALAAAVKAKNEFKDAVDKAKNTNADADIVDAAAKAEVAKNAAIKAVTAWQVALGSAHREGADTTQIEVSLKNARDLRDNVLKQISESKNILFPDNTGTPQVGMSPEKQAALTAQATLTRAQALYNQADKKAEAIQADIDADQKLNAGVSPQKAIDLAKTKAIDLAKTQATAAKAADSYLDAADKAVKAWQLAAQAQMGGPEHERLVADFNAAVAIKRSAQEARDKYAGMAPAAETVAPTIAPPAPAAAKEPPASTEPANVIVPGDTVRTVQGGTVSTRFDESSGCIITVWAPKMDAHGKRTGEALVIYSDSKNTKWTHSEADKFRGDMQKINEFRRAHYGQPIVVHVFRGSDAQPPHESGKKLRRGERLTFSDRVLGVLGTNTRLPETEKSPGTGKRRHIELPALHDNGDVLDSKGAIVNKVIPKGSTFTYNSATGAVTITQSDEAKKPDAPTNAPAGTPANTPSGSGEYRRHH